MEPVATFGFGVVLLVLVIAFSVGFMNLHAGSAFALAAVLWLLFLAVACPWDRMKDPNVRGVVFACVLLSVLYLFAYVIVKSVTDSHDRCLHRDCSWLT